MYSFFMQLFGQILTASTYVILALHVYGYFSVIAQVLKRRLGVFFGLIWISIGISLVYNIVFNHFWAMVIKPGGPRELMENENLRKENKNRENRKAAKINLEGDAPAAVNAPRKGTAEAIIEDEKFTGLQKDVKRLIKYRIKTMGNLRGFWNRKCSQCNELKPARTHHCSVCDTCIFQMSHHCLFTNNCVGLENQRFFLLFILYSWVGVMYNMISIISIWNHYIYKENHKLMSFLFVLDFLLNIALFVYNVWCWSLAASGLTTIEFIGRTTNYKMNNYDFTFTRSRDNLFKIFGTKSVFQMLSPSLRYLAFNGIEWSFQMKDLGFNEFGELSNGGDEESSLANSSRALNQSTGGNVELSNMGADPDGDEEAENTEIAI